MEKKEHARLDPGTPWPVIQVQIDAVHPQRTPRGTTRCQSLFRAAERGRERERERQREAEREREREIKREGGEGEGDRKKREE